MHDGACSGIDDAREEDENFDIFERIDKGWYDVQLHYPTRPSKPRLPIKHNSNDAILYARHLETYEANKKNFQEQLNAYRREGKEMSERFKKDAIIYCGLKGHRKADDAYNLAYENERDSGLAAVVRELNVLADLIL